MPSMKEMVDDFLEQKRILAYCEPVDPFHAGMRWFMRVTGKLPK